MKVRDILYPRREMAYPFLTLGVFIYILLIEIGDDLVFSIYEVLIGGVVCYFLAAGLTWLARDKLLKVEGRSYLFYAVFAPDLFGFVFSASLVIAVLWVFTYIDQAFSHPLVIVVVAPAAVIYVLLVSIDRVVATYTRELITNESGFRSIYAIVIGVPLIIAWLFLLARLIQDLLSGITGEVLELIETS